MVPNPCPNYFLVPPSGIFNCPFSTHLRFNSYIELKLRRVVTNLTQLLANKIHATNVEFSKGTPLVVLREDRRYGATLETLSLVVGG